MKMLEVESILWEFWGIQQETYHFSIFTHGLCGHDSIKASVMIIGLALLWIRMFTIRQKDKLFSWEQSSLKKMQLICYTCHPWSLQLHWTNDDKLKDWEQILSSCCLLSGFSISCCWQYRSIICLKQRL